jgi:hypothetical protein
MAVDARDLPLEDPEVAFLDAALPAAVQPDAGGHTLLGHALS